IPNIANIKWEASHELDQSYTGASGQHQAYILGSQCYGTPASNWRQDGSQRSYRCLPAQWTPVGTGLQGNTLFSPHSNAYVKADALTSFGWEDIPALKLR
ncbi:hypothetical protein F442_10081, partial [Phytophthora nicotianae P10297]